MATVILTDAYIAVNGRNLSQYCSSVAIQDTAETVALTGYAKGAYGQDDQGFKDAVITARFFSDHSNNGLHQFLKPLYQTGAMFTVEVRSTSKTVNAQNPRATMTAHLYGYNVIAGEVGDPSGFDAVFRNASPTGLEWLTTPAAYTAEITATTGIVAYVRGTVARRVALTAVTSIDVAPQGQRVLTGQVALTANTSVNVTGSVTPSAGQFQLYPSEVLWDSDNLWPSLPGLSASLGATTGVSVQGVAISGSPSVHTGIASLSANALIVVTEIANGCPFGKSLFMLWRVDLTSKQGAAWIAMIANIAVTPHRVRKRQVGIGAVTHVTVAGSRVQTEVVLWTAGVETGDLSEWDQGYGGGEFDTSPGYSTASTDVAHSGYWSAAQVYGGGFSGTRLFRWGEMFTNRAITITQWMYIPSVPTVGNWWWIQEFKTTRASDGNNQASWVVDAYNGGATGLIGRFSWVLWQYDNSTEGPQPGQYGNRAIGTVALPIATWFKSKLYMKQSKDFDGGVAWWLNDVLIGSCIPCRTSWPGNTRSGAPWDTDMGYACISYGESLSPVGFTIYVDDVAISRST